ncbi:hypothetical protein H5410_032123 [Solanum commersonii]|uniref:Uncharacterized protein n=1 Tax=Solanum commersonii TaxID=4109 RepID=A0A9J5YK87_SOLCO|nr:hypothetical protein H5410_032123 [Solanum commersonii]
MVDGHILSDTKLIVSKACPLLCTNILLQQRQISSNRIVGLNPKGSPSKNSRRPRQNPGRRGGLEIGKTPRGALPKILDGQGRAQAEEGGIPLVKPGRVHVFLGYRLPSIYHKFSGLGFLLMNHSSTYGLSPSSVLNSIGPLPDLFNALVPVIPAFCLFNWSLRARTFDCTRTNACIHLIVICACFRTLCPLTSACSFTNPLRARKARLACKIRQNNSLLEIVQLRQLLELHLAIGSVIFPSDNHTKSLQLKALNS